MHICIIIIIIIIFKNKEKFVNAENSRPHRREAPA